MAKRNNSGLTGISLVFAVIVFVLVAASIARAQNEALILDSNADYTFGEELRFSLQAQNAEDVKALALTFRPELSPNTYQVDVPFKPGSVISVTQAVNVGMLDIRPFSNVTYSWSVQSSLENQTTPEQHFTYEDDHLQWHTMVRDAATVHWTGQGPILGQSVLDIVDTTLDHLATVLPLHELRPFDVYVFPSSADMRSSLGIAGVEIEDTDLLELGVLPVTSVNSQTAESDLQQSVPYKLAQLLLYRAAGSQYPAIPWWLREGIAVDSRPTGNQRHNDLLARAVQADETIPLWRLCTEPQETGDRAELATIQSASLLRFISETRPSGTIPELVASYIDGDNCEQGVQRVLGYSLDDLEQEWLNSQREPSQAKSLLNDIVIWLALLLAGTFLVFLLFKATQRKEQQNDRRE